MGENTRFDRLLGRSKLHLHKPTLTRKRLCQPVEVVKVNPISGQCFARAHHYTPCLWFKPHHIERLGTTADAYSPTLPHGEADNAIMRCQHAAAEVHDLARIDGAGPQLLDHASVGAVRYEADVLTVGLGSYGQAKALGE